MATSRDHRLAVLTRPKDLQRVAELLSETADMQPLDALIAVQHTPSVLPAPMTAGECETMIALLQGLGVRAVAVPSVELPDFENPVVIHHARCLPTAFEILEQSGEPLGQIPWASIAVAAIGAIPGRTTRTCRPLSRSSRVPAVRRTRNRYTSACGAVAFCHRSIRACA